MSAFPSAPHDSPPRRRLGDVLLWLGAGGLVFLVLAAVTVGILLQHPAPVRTAPGGGPAAMATPTVAPPTTPDPSEPVIDPGTSPLYDAELLAARCPDVEVRRTAVPADELEPYLDSLIGCLVQTHREPFERVGLELSRPALLPETEIDGSGCTIAQDEPGDWAGLYCGANRTIYYRTDWHPNDPVQHVEVMAHEFTHHLQNEAGILHAVSVAQQEASDQPNGEILLQDQSRRLELQAECLTGMMVGPNGPLALSPAELTRFIDARASIPPDWAATHGTGRAQTRWFTQGSQAAGSLRICNTFAAPAQLVR